MNLKGLRRQRNRLDSFESPLIRNMGIRPQKRIRKMKKAKRITNSPSKNHKGKISRNLIRKTF